MPLFIVQTGRGGFLLRIFLIFEDIHGRKWICGHALRILFGMVEAGKKFFWDYDSLCEVRHDLSRVQ